MSEFRQKLKNEFKEKEYAHAYAEGFLNSYIATQIKVLREQRGWSQERLAQEAQMKQERISVLEDVDYGSWSLNTLRRLAAAFDVALTVSFETFGKKIQEIEAFSRPNLERIARAEEFSDAGPIFRESIPSSIFGAIKEWENSANKANSAVSAAQATPKTNLLAGIQEQERKQRNHDLAGIGV